MNKVALLVTTFVFSACGCSGHLSTAPQRSATTPDKTSSVDFRRWHDIGDAKWTVEAHAVEIQGTTNQHNVSGYLLSPDTYTNFKLTLELWIDDDTNSGIFVRCQDRRSITPLNCYEANIWDNHPNQNFRTGSIVTLMEPSTKVHTIGRWNRYEISAVDNIITVSVNGTQTVKLSNDTHSTGFIALQYDGKRTVKFRDLEIVEY